MPNGRYMPNGTVHAKWDSTCQMGQYMPNGTVHANWDSTCQMKCFAVKSRPIVDQVSFNVKFPKWEISENYNLGKIPEKNALNFRFW